MNKSKIAHSPRYDIPICRIFTDENGEPKIEFKSSRTKKTEVFTLSGFVSWIVHEATVLPD